MYQHVLTGWLGSLHTKFIISPRNELKQLIWLKESFMTQKQKWKNTLFFKEKMLGNQCLRGDQTRGGVAAQICLPGHRLDGLLVGWPDYYGSREVNNRSKSLYNSSKIP